MNQEPVILPAEQHQPRDGTLACYQTLGTWQRPTFEPVSVPWAENAGREACNELSTATPSWRGRWALVHSRLWCGPTVVVLWALRAHRQECFEHEPSRRPTVRSWITQ
jgi:hypothetical protein